jgi:hypothetical protein
MYSTCLMFRTIIVLQALLNHPTNVLHQIQYNKNLILAQKKKEKKINFSMEPGSWASLGRFWFNSLHYFKELLKQYLVDINVTTLSSIYLFLKFSLAFKWFFSPKKKKEKKNLQQNISFSEKCVAFRQFFCQ